MTDRATVHALLDKVLDGGHEGNINAMVATMRVYAAAVDERKELEELRREAAELDARIKEMEKSVVNTLEPRGTA